MENRTFATPYQTAGCAEHNTLTAMQAFELVQCEADRKVLTDAFESWAESDQQPNQEVLIKKYVDFATHQTSKWLQMLPAGWKFQELGKAKKTLKALMTVEEVVADVGTAAAKQLTTKLNQTCTNNRLREEEQRRAGGQHGETRSASVQATALTNERSETESLAVPADAKRDQSVLVADVAHDGGHGNGDGEDASNASEDQEDADGEELEDGDEIGHGGGDESGAGDPPLSLRLRRACIAAARDPPPNTVAILKALWSTSERSGAAWELSLPPLPGEDECSLAKMLLELHPSNALQLLLRGITSSVKGQV